ncbi:hypothetical protein ADICYQ_4126 [Cyclobacterium qasimii M12-11B]|uniref:Uncharacterized protein n=1 Tax=Cyclobacterium qasimii M12-11B TaxID=641524 RepID=S7V9D8_9BACT|nr:hypothetical protein ADICYQ_4126 [Cyclobacterium qasimii M12-11B]
MESEASVLKAQSTPLIQNEKITGIIKPIPASLENSSDRNWQ